MPALKLQHLNISLKAKISIAFFLILIIPSISIGILGYNSAKSEMENQILNTASTNVDLLNSNINNFLNPKFTDADFFSNIVNSHLYKGEDSPEVRKYLDRYVNLHPEVQGIYVGTMTGLMIESPRKQLPSGYDPRKRGWYQQAIQNSGKVIITPPYIAASTGKMTVTIAKTLQDNSGVIGINLSLNAISKMTNSIKIGENGYAFLLSKERQYLVHPTQKIGSEAKESLFDKLYQSNSGKFQYIWKGQNKEMVFTTNELTGWKLAGTMLITDASDAASPIFNRTFLVVLISLIMGGSVIFLLVGSFIKPIRNLKDKVLKMSSGDLTEQIHVKSNDEIGELSKAFNGMQNNFRNLIKKIEVSAEQVASHTGHLAASTEQTNAATEEVAKVILEVASGAEKQTSGLESNVKFLEETTKGMIQIVDHSGVATELSAKACEQAEEGGKSVHRTMAQMNSISDSVHESNNMIKSLDERSKEIGAILDMISGIADQTNLLALNAAIEAARVGEHGKGFAVVADEVRKLAEQSQTSAKQISELIKGIQNDTNNTVQIMGKVTEEVEDGIKISSETIRKFDEIMNSMRKMTPKMEEISDTVQHISAGIQEVTATANGLANIARDNAAISEEVAASTQEQQASAEQVSASARSLSEMAEDLKTLIKEFVY
ncbi:methyl-accepting chemotaxis protein [Bacillus sp. BRMEA1]|uniref:methyl-accepting chemotaxis protein n=1 Tax=Neobacillus endophyticus TaxID=2738405 RepID=UPI001564B010|nr:methyl-accepting chemotaxis protein [Neobacillus endophyticus]NRD78097.1 methyl-accepting chemotaxis protein [Neobacillus endophyticus]